MGWHSITQAVRFPKSMYKQQWSPHGNTTDQKSGSQLVQNTLDLQAISSTPEELGRLFARHGGLLECHGPGQDDSDPLWEEISCALREEGEDIGDADLPPVSRKRLAANGQYFLVNEDTADEWLCLPAEALVIKLAAVREKVTRSRSLWFADDLLEARHLWTRVHDGLKLEVSRQGPQSRWRGSEGDLAHAAVAVHHATSMQAMPVPPHALQSLLTARAAVVHLQGRLALEVQEAHAMGEVDEDDMQTNIGELVSCLDRCAFIAKAELAGCEEASLSNKDCSRAPPLAPGAAVEVQGLAEAAERGLNGQPGFLERYDEALGLWQLRLLASGTRLLLAEGHLRYRPPEGDWARRQQWLAFCHGEVKSLAQLAREAAKAGDLILVHHAVPSTDEDMSPQAT